MPDLSEVFTEVFASSLSLAVPEFSFVDSCSKFWTDPSSDPLFWFSSSFFARFLFSFSRRLNSLLFDDFWGAGVAGIKSSSFAGIKVSSTSEKPSL